MKTIRITGSDVLTAPTTGGWWMYQRIGWRYDQWDFVLVNYTLSYFRRMMDAKEHSLPETDEPGRWIGPLDIKYGTKRT